MPILSSDFLPAIEIESDEHPTHTILWMHGLGADGNDFVPIIQELELPPETTIRFIFPHAPKQSVTINGGLVMRAWYDIKNINLDHHEDEAGIRSSQQAIMAMIKRENQRGIPSANIVLAGFSQGGVMALQVTLEVRRAQIVAMVGSNGAGKTTLLRALSQLIAWHGEISFDGHPLAGLTPDEVFALGMVQVPEGRQLFDRMSVEENLLMGAYRRKDKAGIRDSLEHNYQLFPVLAERRRQLAGSMSGGEQQMCAMARALMAAPRLMLVDEMSLGLSPVIVDLLLDVLTEIRRQGVTVLLVEQDVFSALHIADRGYVMEMGHIVREGVAGQLAVDPEVQRAYLGV